ncbi:MAG: thiolase domain-containing protein [Halanaerobiales bacterium]
MSVSIIGTAHTEFGRLDKSVYALMEEVGKGALDNSPVSAEDIGGVWIGNFSGGGFNNQEHLGPYAVNIDEKLRFTPVTRVENACASGSAAIRDAKNALEAGEVDYALVLGVEKMTSLDTKGVTKVLAMASYWPDEGAEGMTFPGLFAEFAKGYREKYNYDLNELREIFAKIAAKNHRNALENPLAQMPWDCTYEDILDMPEDKNPMIAEPLRLYDCSLITDGAAAIVLTRTDDAKRVADNFVEIAALTHTTDYLSIKKRSNYEFTAGKKAVEKAYKKAGISVEDLDFAEVHDCFTIAELLAYETLGLAEDGRGGDLLGSGVVEAGGSTPVNVSGGLKAKGHPVGATGVSMAVLAARQLMGNAIGHQIKGAKTGITFNIGGSAASNYALVFKKK